MRLKNRVTGLEKKSKKRQSERTEETSNSSELQETKSSQVRPLIDDSFNMIQALDKFRSSLLMLLILFIIITGISFFYSDLLLYFINKPFIESGNRLNIFTLMGGFMIKFKISAATAIFILMPVIILQIWKIIVPSIARKNRMFSRITVISAIILFYSGVCFVFFLLLPAAIKVMLSFVGNDMISTIGADNYFGFILFFSLSMGVLFEVPVVVLVLTRMGMITPEFLSRKRKFAIVIIWIIAAVITPQPDPLSQAMVGVPLMLIYEISIIISKLVAKKRFS
jgi:sec-independent protein translocase protein TatC